MNARPAALALVLVSVCAGAACNGTSEPTAPAPPVIDSGSSQNPAGSPPPDRPTPPLPPPPEPDRNSCDDKKAAFAIGGTASDDLLERARVAAGARTARFLRLDQPITLEFQAGRLNLSLDAQSIVRKVTCG